MYSKKQKVKPDTKFDICYHGMKAQFIMMNSLFWYISHFVWLSSYGNILFWYKMIYFWYSKTENIRIRVPIRDFLTVLNSRYEPLSMTRYLWWNYINYQKKISFNQTKTKMWKSNRRTVPYLTFEWLDRSQWIFHRQKGIEV